MMKKSSLLFVGMFTLVALTGCSWWSKKEEATSPATETEAMAPATPEGAAPEATGEVKDAAASIKNITTKEDFENTIKSDKVVVVKFYAEWCGVCKDMQPAFDDVVKAYLNKCEFVAIDIDKAKELAEAQNIKGVPTVVIFKKGQELDRTTGKMSKEELEIKIKETVEEEAEEAPANK
jgi:thioredoxin 1